MLDEEKDLKIERKELTPQDKKEKEQEIPKYMSLLELSKEDQDRIVEEICTELDEIEREEKEDKKPEYWEEMDNLYKGCLSDSEDQQFNLSNKTAKVKMTAIVRSLKEAFFEVDPSFSISARPEFDLKNGEEVTGKQEDFLDYKFDEVIPLKPAMSKVFLSATSKGTGILKLFYETRRVTKKREEEYIGKNVETKDPTTGQVIEMKNEGLENFVRNYPTCVDPESAYHSYFQELVAEKTINIVVEYKCLEYNDPMPKYVERKNFKVRRHVEGYQGLCRSQFHGEREEFAYWDLKKMEEGENQFYNIDQLIYDEADADKEIKDRKPINNYDHQNYEIYECVFWTKLKSSDKEESRCVFWIERKKKIMVGSIRYPFYEVDSYYIPFNIKQEVPGFDQPGVGEDLKDSSLAEDAILNFTLEGWWASNQMTPIVKEGSGVESQFLEKRWAHGVPLTLGSGEEAPDWMNKYMKPMDAANGIQLVQYLVQGQDNISGVSSLLTGRESPVDPTAPASKTLALLERSGINIKDYIREVVPSYNLIPTIALQLYDQMNTEGIKFRIKKTAEAVAGANPFGTITRAEMRARTTIQSQASSFNFNKNNEKREDLALYSTLRQEPLVARNPKAVYEILRALVKGWSPKWRNRIDKVLPSFEQFQQEQGQVAVQAVAMYVQAVLKQAQVTKQPPAFDPMQLLAVVQDAVAQQVTPVSKEAQEGAKNQ